MTRYVSLSSPAVSSATSKGRSRRACSAGAAQFVKHDAAGHFCGPDDAWNWDQPSEGFIAEIRELLDGHRLVYSCYKLRVRPPGRIIDRAY
ncbi:hypothetical protein [Mycolicibacterium lutetiense]